MSSAHRFQVEFELFQTVGSTDFRREEFHVVHRAENSDGRSTSDAAATGEQQRTGWRSQNSITTNDRVENFSEKKNIVVTAFGSITADAAFDVRN